MLDKAKAANERRYFGSSPSLLLPLDSSSLLLHYLFLSLEFGRLCLPQRNSKA
ncbi:hypothetical protein MUK42_14420 [Musa troglodytarum]|uniref:Uncharacterized protein n=1 Tax=Musa troglodytarum TaxID=320322 RepID=A0A9E7ID88_9LILI|nr:hypothetical protein MUK42_14420 [Musa troglodytarum]